jgi:hypothetical protein
MWNGLSIAAARGDATFWAGIAEYVEEEEGLL